MSLKATALIFIALLASILVACDKAPGGVIPESDMVHVLADFAKAEALIDQYPNKFPDDSSKLALKQSILKRYDADLAMYDSSLVWYAHNLKLYSELHDKAVLILEKEGNIKHDDKAGGNQWPSTLPNAATSGAGATRRVFPTTGDSANVWTQPQRWILTSAMHRGFITYDYKPDAESRNGDLYSLNIKAINSSGNNIKILLAVDYTDGTTSYVTRTLNVGGWSNYDLQADSTRTVKRIYGFLQYNIKPQRVTFIDSIYLLRTHLDLNKYHYFTVQRKAGPKAAFEKDSIRQQPKPEQQLEPSLSRLPASQRLNRDAMTQRGARPPRSGDSIYRPKPGLNKSAIHNHERITNPNGAHVPKPPIH